MIYRVMRRLWKIAFFREILRVGFPWWELQPFDFVVLGTFFFKESTYTVMLELATNRLFYYVKVQEEDSHASSN